jgi:hypothetical protein
MYAYDILKSPDLKSTLSFDSALGDPLISQMSIILAVFSRGLFATHIRVRNTGFLAIANTTGEWIFGSLYGAIGTWKLELSKKAVLKPHLHLGRSISN